MSDIRPTFYRPKFGPIIQNEEEKESYLSFSTLCQEHSHWKPAESKKDPLGVVWPDIKRSKVSQGQSDNGLNISLTGSESAHGATGASHASLSSHAGHIAQLFKQKI